MTEERAVVGVRLEFRLEKFNAETGELEEVVIGSDAEPPQVIFRKEQENGLNQRG